VDMMGCDVTRVNSVIIPGSPSGLGWGGGVAEKKNII
jgi:hypothetical protein